MLKRTITGVALIAVLIVVMLLMPAWCTGVLLSVMVALAAYELMKTTGLVDNVYLIGIAVVTAVNVVWWCFCGMHYPWALAVLLMFVVLCFAQLLRSHGQLPFQQVAITMVAGILIPFLLSALVRIRIMENGVYWIAAPFVMAFLPDVGAYFVGSAIGKHKLCPNISPKKTVEGLFGGFLGGIVGMLVYALVLEKFFGFTSNYFYAAIYGVIGAGAATFGDLMLSVIKRQTGIKDYGKLLPGHGGILDRFDSVALVAPVAELLLLAIPFVVK